MVGSESKERTCLFRLPRPPRVIFAYIGNMKAGELPLYSISVRVGRLTLPSKLLWAGCGALRDVAQTVRLS